MSNYGQRAYEIQSTVMDTVKALIQDETPSSLRLAKKEISLAQADIRAVKKEVTDEQREVRAAFQEESRKITAGGQGASLAAGALFGKSGRRAVSAGRASAKNSLTQRKNAAMADFDRTKAYIDRLVMDLSKVKLEIDRALAANG